MFGNSKKNVFMNAPKIYNSFGRVSILIFCFFLAKHFVLSIDGMTKVIHRLESHAETDQPIEEVKNSLECD